MTAYRHYFSPAVIVAEIQSSTGRGAHARCQSSNPQPNRSSPWLRKSQEESSEEEEVTKRRETAYGELTVIRLATASGIGELITG